jgi:hypothetical protein
MTRNGTFFNAKCVQKWTAMVLFLTLLDRLKNHVFYERKRMKKLFLTDIKKTLFISEIPNFFNIYIERNWVWDW